MLERCFRLALALVTWAGLSTQLYILMMSEAFGSPALAIWRFLAFFTILTNIVVAATASVSAIAPQSAAGRFVDRANMRAAVLLWISAVGIVYHVALSGLWNPQGLQRIADAVLHTATPVLVAAGWLLFDNKTGLTFKRSIPFLIYPVGYAFYALFRGAGDGFYPYPFIDVSQLGYARVLVNIFALLAAFLFGSAIISVTGRAVPERAPRRDLSKR